MSSEDPFASAESYYAEYRPRYGDRPIDYLADRFDFDESARALDLGCGAGQIAVPLAATVGTVVGMDPNERMIDEAREQARAAGRENVEWVVGSDADLRGEVGERLGPFRVTTMGRSFHWMDREPTLDRIRELTEPAAGSPSSTTPSGSRAVASRGRTRCTPSPPTTATICPNAPVRAPNPTRTRTTN
ncbi:class I SAM-dependent methyltransferase [Halosimplex aquaticum]